MIILVKAADLRHARRMKACSTIAFLLLLATSACITTEELDGRLSTWVGHDSDELATSWGAPTGTYQKKDGTKILSYDRMGVITTGPGYFAQTYSRHCRIDFVTDKNGKIVSASWHGAADQCDRSIAPFQ